MTWTNVYLVCFLLGFLLSAASWLLGVAGLHPHIHAHGGPHGHVHVHADAPHAGGGHSHATSAATAPSTINFSTLMAFLAWFGGAGYLLTRYTELWPIASLLVASGVGLVGSAIVFLVMAKVLWSAAENLDPDDYDVVGLLGTVSSPIRPGGTGEILFQQAGARRVAGAPSENGGAIEKSGQIGNNRYEKGVAHVPPRGEPAPGHP